MNVMAKASAKGGSTSRAIKAHAMTGTASKISDINKMSSSKLV